MLGSGETETEHEVIPRLVGKEQATLQGATSAFHR
jgi:hypothetical protein